MNNKTPVSMDSMQASIFAREDIFHVLRKLPLYLETGERSRRKERLERFQSDLHTAAWAKVTEYQESKTKQVFPAYCAEGQEANWLWLDDKLQYCCGMRYPASADFLLATCKVIEEEYEYSVPSDTGKARIIMEYLEQKYGYLSKVITPNGLHLLLFPTISRASDYFEFSTKRQPGGGIKSCGIIFTGRGDRENAVEFLVYESVTATILEHHIQGDTLTEKELVALEEHWDPMLRAQRPEDQIGAYYDAIMMGLSHQAPYGDFACFNEYSADDKMFWSECAARLIDELAKEAAV